MRVRHAALGLALVVSAPVAGAQQWWQLCTGDANGTSCAAVHVGFTALGPSSTQLAVRAQNLQGTFAGGTGASVLEQLYFHFGSSLPTVSDFTDQPTAGPGVTSYAGTGNLAGTTVGPWSYLADGGTIALLADNPPLGHFTDVRGCAGPSPLEDPGFVTCGPRGTRWVEFVFDVAATLTDADLQSVGFGTSFSDFGLDQHVCNDVPNANVACRVERFTPGQVVPEPATFALLGGGLVALGLVVRRRRVD